VIAQIETDKVTIDIKYSNKESGTVTQLSIKQGDVVQVGKLVCSVDVGNVVPSVAEVMPKAEAAKPAAAAKHAPAAKHAAAPKPAAAAPPPPPPKVRADRRTAAAIGCA
jgi:pyruvate/2-oxoglutarate dehydrogenase complex dihydrolipoamide acyltransferase (E2) component